MYVTEKAPYEKLNIEIDNNSIKRFSCAAHKLNLAIRHAIELHPEFKALLANLGDFCSTMRNSKEFKEVINIIFCFTKLIKKLCF